MDSDSDSETKKNDNAESNDGIHTYSDASKTK